MISTEVTLEAEIRQQVGKSAARHLRREGKAPVVLYGGEDRPLALAVDKGKLLEVFRKFGHTRIFTLLINGETAAPVIIKDWQVDPMKGTLIHADLLRVNMAKLTRVRVPVEVAGEAFGVKSQGGLLDFSTHELEVECLPADIPARIHLDVSGLKVGDHITVKDLNLGERVKVLEDAERVIVGVLPPRIEEVAAPAPVAVKPAEPEVIKKGKVEEKEGGET